MSRLSQTIAYLTAEKITQEDIITKFTDLTVDKKMIKLRRKYRHAIKQQKSIEQSVIDKERSRNGL